MADDQRNANVVLTADNTQYDRSMQQSTSNTNNLLSSVIALSNGMNTLAQKAGKKIQLIGVGEVAALTAATAAAARFDAQTSQLQANAIMTGRSFEGMAKQINNVRAQFSVTTDQAVALQQQLRQMGQTQGVDKVTASMLRLGAVTGESVGALTTGLIGLQRQFGTMGSSYTERFAAGLANVSAKSGVAASSVLDFSNAIAPVARVAGISQQEVMGFSAAFVKAGQDGGIAATAFSKMLTDITRSVQYGSPELKAYANLIGVSVAQFKQMPRAEAVTRIFEEISKQGPDAIKTLERFGLDGIRTYRALQGVASQGGIRSAVDQVNEGMSNQGVQNFADASKEAMKGLSDELKILGNNLTMVGEAFGKAFVGPTTKVIGAINAVVRPLASMLQTLGNIPGVSAAAGASMLILGGTVVRSLGLMTGLAAVRQFTGGTSRSGYLVARRGEDAPRFAQRALDRVESGQGTLLQRATFRAGAYIGGVRNDIDAQRERRLVAMNARRAQLGLEPLVAGSGRGIRGMASQLGVRTIQGLGYLGRAQLDMLQPGRMRNPIERVDSPTALRTEEFGRSIANLGRRAQQTFGIATGRTDMAAGAVAAREANALRNAESAALRAAIAARRGEEGEIVKSSSLFRALAVETAKFSKSLVLADVGGARMMARGAGRGLGMIGGAVGSFLGGPVGVAIGAGMLGFSAYERYRTDRKNMEAAGFDAEATDAAGSAFRIALGEGAKAVTSFADVVKSASKTASNQDNERPGVVSDTMVAEAEAPGRQFTDKRISSMSENEAKNYVASTNYTDKDRVLLGYDLVKRFGQSKAQDILNYQGSQNGSLDETYLFSQIRGADTQAVKTAAATGKANNAEVAANAGGGALGARESSRYNIASINAASKAFMRGGDEGGIFSALASQLGITENDPRARNDFKNLIAPSIDRQADGTVRTSTATFQTMIDRIKGDPSTYQNSAFAQALLNMQSRAGTGFDPTSSRYNPSWAAQAPTGQLAYANVANLSAVKGTNLGGQLFNGKSFGGALVDDSLAAPDNSNLANRAMRQMADSAMATGKSFSEAASQLQDMKLAIGDSSDYLYKLADSAQAYLAQQQQEAMGRMTRAQVAGQLVSNYNAALADAEKARGSDGQSDAEQRVNDTRSALAQNKNQAYDFFRQLAKSVQEFTISTQQSQDDFTRQRQRSDYDYNLSRERAQQDFDRQRQRGEDQFNRSLKRNQRDYDRSRQQQQADFNKQRLRSEADYQHQVQLMQEQAAKSLYNIYERVNVQRTWSAQNLLQNSQDQIQRLSQQTDNLSQARKMGVSSDVIKMLGLNETENAQQLARFVADLADDPSLVKAYNEMAKKRLDASKKLVTDKDNTQWQEMERSFKLNAQRAAEDFGTATKRQAEAFAIGLADMRQDYNISLNQATDDFNRARSRQETDYNLSVTRMIADFGRQMDRAQAAFSRSVEEMTGGFDDLAKAAISGLTGTAKKQAQALYDQLKTVSTQTKAMAKTLASDVAHLFAAYGVTGDVTSGGQDRASSGGASTHGGQTKGAAYGGYIGGTSPHKRADDKLYRLTSGEYVHNVDAVSYYGQGFMDAINKKQIPKSELTGFASGGLVPFGRKLQSMDYQVSEHPLFGGVHPVHAKNSWHYKAGAIDVNHDQGNEKNAINQIINMARQFGLRVIWQVKDHFDHAHFDIGTGPDMIGPGVPQGHRNASGDYDLLAAIKKLKSVKQWENIRKAHPYLARNWPADSLAEAIANSFMPGGSGDMAQMAGPSSVGASRNAALGRKMAAAKGWTGANWDALNWIYMHESGWNERAKNPTSDAYGIPQALPGSKMASAGNDWLTNPATQIKWGLGYIQDRYGTPVKAQQWWKNHNWYGNGGVFSGAQNIGVGEHGPEMVLPLNGKGADFLLAVMQQYASSEAKRVTGTSRGIPTPASSTTYNTRIDKSTRIDAVHVVSQDPNDMLRKIEAKKRLEALTGARR